MQKRKGFTLVELVIVIAVIAILAGVLIGTFASVINRANESARVQEVKAQEIQQKADDILKKIEDSNWYGWEDFETSIVAKLTKAYKENSGAALDTATVKEAVTAAMNDYATAHAGDSTSLTEAQVKAIVENALGTLKFEGVTEAQVKTIINEATSNVLSKQLTEAQVKAVVEAANAKNLTAAQVSAEIAKQLTGVVTTTDLETKLATVVSTLNSSIEAIDSNLSEEQIKQIIEELVPVTIEVKDAVAFGQKVNTLNSGSTIVWAGETNETLTLATDDVKTLTVKGKIGTLNVDAKNATVYVVGEVTTLNVVAVANNSLHVYGTVQDLTVNKGRAVLESGARITGELVASPSSEARVVVEIEQGATVEKLVAEYKKNTAGTNDYIEISNKGSVDKAELGLAGDGPAVTTNVRFTNEEGSQGTTSDKLTASDDLKEANVGVELVIVENEAAAQYDVTAGTGVLVEDPTANTSATFWGELYATSFAGGTGSVVDPYQISTVAQLMRLSYLMLAEPETYRGLNYVLTADIDIAGKTWMPISAYGRDSKYTNKDNENVSTAELWFCGTFDGQGHTINGLSDTGINNLFHAFFTSSNSTTVSGMNEYTYGLFGSVTGAKIKNLTLSKVSISNVNDGTHVADSVGSIVGYCDGDLTLTNCSASGNVSASDGVGGIIGRIYNKYTDYSATVVLSNLTSAVNVNAHESATKGKAGGILGYADSKNINGASTHKVTISFVKCKNTGNVTGVDYAGGIATLTKANINYSTDTCTNEGNVALDSTKTTKNDIVMGF